MPEEGSLKEHHNHGSVEVTTVGDTPHVSLNHDYGRKGNNTLENLEIYLRMVDWKNTYCRFFLLGWYLSSGALFVATKTYTHADEEGKKRCVLISRSGAGNSV